MQQQQQQQEEVSVRPQCVCGWDEWWGVISVLNTAIIHTSIDSFSSTEAAPSPWSATTASTAAMLANPLNVAKAKGKKEWRGVEERGRGGAYLGSGAEERALKAWKSSFSKISTF